MLLVMKSKGRGQSRKKSVIIITLLVLTPPPHLIVIIYNPNLTRGKFFFVFLDELDYFKLTNKKCDNDL